MLETDAASRILIDDVYSSQDIGQALGDKTVFHVSRWNRATVERYVAARGDVGAKLPASPAPASPLGDRRREREGVHQRRRRGGARRRRPRRHHRHPEGDQPVPGQPGDRQRPRSGAVYLPTGVYRITAPLTLPSGVVLVGDGSGTVIRYSGTGAAIRFSDPSGTVVGAGLENLGIGAERGGGIGDVRGVPLVNCRLTDLVFNSLAGESTSATCATA